MSSGSAAPRRRPPRPPPGRSRRRRRSAAREGSARFPAAGRTTTRPARAASAGAPAATRPPPVSSLKRSCRRLLISLDRQRAHPRGGELQRQRNAFEAGAQLGDRRRLALGQREAGLVQPRALHEQLHGFGSQQRFEPALAVGHRQRQHGIGLLARTRSASRLVAMIRTLRRGAQQRVGERRARADQMLAVVEDQQQLARLEVRAQRLQRAACPAPRARPAPAPRRSRPATRRGSARGRRTRRRPDTPPARRRRSAATGASCRGRPCRAA